MCMQLFQCFVNVLLITLAFKVNMKNFTSKIGLLFSIKKFQNLFFDEISKVHSLFLQKIIFKKL